MKRTTALSASHPSLFDLWTTYKFDSGRLNIAAKVPPHTVVAMLSNQPVKLEEAQKVLDALSLLLHKEFTLETVHVELIAEKVHEKP